MSKIGKNANTTDTTNILSPISVDSITSTTLVPANLPSSQKIKAMVSNFGNKTLWVKEQAAAVDNDKKGIPVLAGATITVFNNGDEYSGEVSGIMDSGGAKDVYVVWQ